MIVAYSTYNTIIIHHHTSPDQITRWHSCCKLVQHHKDNNKLVHVKHPCFCLESKPHLGVLYGVQSYLFNTTLDNTTTSILRHKSRKPNFLVQIYLYTTTMTKLIRHSKTSQMSYYRVINAFIWWVPHTYTYINT